MPDFNAKFAAYFAMLQAFLHIGAQAVHEVQTAAPETPALDKLSAHLDSYAATVDAVGAIVPVVTATVEAAQTAAAPVPVSK